VGTALFLDERSLGLSERLFRGITGIFFWPLYLPLLLQSPSAKRKEDREIPRQPVPRDELQQAISQVEGELQAALNSLDGWAEVALSHAGDRFDELRAAWSSQAARIRELDQLLSQPEFLSESNGAKNDAMANFTRGQSSEASRRENIARLHEVRGKMREELMGTLAWVRELVTMIHLAKFTGAPASRAEELVAQIASTVEGLSEVTQWNHQPLSAER
jgi:hypothetical protein